MADRYWVGGTGSWDATTTNWSATNGGAGGASVPTLADDVFFTSLSNATAYVCTLTTAPVCRSVSVVGPAAGNVTIAGSAGWNIYGSMTIAATGVTWTHTGSIFFVATTTGWTITTNGVSMGAITRFGGGAGGGGGGWTLGSAFASSTGIQFQNGTLTTNNFSMTTGNNFDSTLLTFARTLNLGSSSITCGAWLGGTVASGLTFNAGTSTITVTNAAGTFFGGGLTYYNVFKNLNGFAIGDANNTFNALTNNNVNTIGTFLCQFAGNQTIGTLTVNGGSDQTRRASIQTTAALAGTQVTLTVASFVTNGNIDFRDINFQGAASPLTVATGGDCGNNTNITLQTPKTVYWSLVAGGNWTATAWAATSGGAPALANYPLAQDTVVIEDTGLTSGNTITLNVSPNLGTIGFSTRTLPMTFSILASASVIYGDLTFSSAVTITSSAAGAFIFSGFNKTQTITSAGVTIEAGVQANNLSTTVTLAANTTLGTTKTFTLTQGTLNLANNTLSCGFFTTSNSNVRNIAFGTGQINLTGNAGTIWNFNTATNLTITGSATVNATYSGSTGTRGLGGYGSGTALINFNVTAGSDIINMPNAGYNNVNFTGFTGQLLIQSTSIFGNLTLNTGMTTAYTSGVLLFYATSGTQLITTNGVTVDAPVTFSGVGGTFQLQDNLTVGSTRIVTLGAGTLNLNAKTLTSGTFTSGGAVVRSIAFNGGTYGCAGATFTASGSNFSTTGSGTISMTSASSKTFNGGGYSYPTLNQGGAGALVITGANTFAGITNTVQPATITFPASTTTTVSNFNVNGTAGNLITLNSSASGTAATVNYAGTGTVFANYLSIQDFTATSSPRWQANTATTTIVSNVTGWIVTNFYYWVGGTGNWDATNTRWAATSGGAGGAGVPTLSDNVFFDSASNATAYVCTLTTTPVCASVNIAGPASGNVTIAGTAAWSIYGSMTIAATGVTWTYTNNIFFVATTTGWTVTTNGVTLNSIVQFSGAGGGWTLGSALTAGNGIQFRNGTLTTNNFSMTTSNNFDVTGANARTLNLGSSTITCQFWGGLGATNLTVNAGTSTITLTGSATFAGAGLTYYNVTKASNGFAILDSGNTFNALTNTTVSSAGTFTCSFAGNQTIGTLTINGGASQNSRISIQTPSTLVGTQVTLTVASFVTNGFIDFRDINFQGAASPLTVATGGDCGNNTNITLQAPKTVYFSFAAGAPWTSNVWALTSGGAPAVANYPLPQDTVIIDDVGLSSGNTLNANVICNVGTINMSARTLPVTFTIGTQTLTIYSNLTLSSAVTSTTTAGSFVFSGFNKTQTVTSAGVTVGSNVNINGRLTTVALSGALSLNAQCLLTQGTLNLANNNLTTSTNFNANGTLTRAITFGTGQINLTGNNAFILNMDNMTGFTYTGSGIFNCTYSGATGTRGIVLGNAGGGTEANALSVNITAGTDQTQVYGLGIRSVNFTGFAGTWGEAGTRYIYGDLTLSTGMTVAATTITQFAGTSGIQNITSNGKTITFPIAKFAASTLRLVDSLTLGSTLTLTLNVGTLDLNAQTATTGLFSSTGAGVRSITFGGGTMVTSGATYTVSGSNFTTSGSGTISMTSASSKTFAGGGFSYPTLNQGGAGTLVITGANTFQNMTNTVQPCTITFPASTTTTTANFNLLGTAGNLITLNSSAPGTQATINNSSGVFVGGDYFSLRDTNATPANTMYAGRNTTNVSNNTGWVFAALFIDSVAESNALTDAQIGTRGQFDSVSDSITLTNTQSAIAAFAPQVAELLTLTELISVQSNWVGYTAETITLVDAQIQRGWVKINNSQNPNWVDVNNYQG